MDNEQPRSASKFDLWEKANIYMFFLALVFSPYIFAYDISPEGMAAFGFPFFIFSRGLDYVADYFFSYYSWFSLLANLIVALLISRYIIKMKTHTMSRFWGISLHVSMIVSWLLINVVYMVWSFIVDFCVLCDRSFNPITKGIVDRILFGIVTNPSLERILFGPLLYIVLVAVTAAIIYALVKLFIKIKGDPVGEESRLSGWKTILARVFASLTILFIVFITGLFVFAD